MKDDYPTASPPPLETERDAVASVQHILDSPPGSWSDGSHRFLEDTCGAADVVLGAYDQQTLLVLASQPPTTVAVIAGLIRRAHAAGLEEGRDALNASGVVFEGGGWISGGART